MYRRLCALLLLSILPLGVSAQESDLGYALEDIFASRDFAGSRFQLGEWAAEGPIVRYVRAGTEDGTTDVVAVNLEDDTEERVIDGSRLFADDVGRPIRVQGYSVSSDGSKVLIYTDSERVWRLPTKGFYYVYDRERESLTPLSDRGRGYQMFAKMSPDGRHVAFVRDRNLYVADLAQGTERALTDDGADGTIINGTFDWVYEEEFGLRDGWAWSPDGRYIAFFKLDESGTRDFRMTDNRGQYPELTTFRYPKAGEENSEVQIGVIDMDTDEIRYFDTGTWMTPTEPYEYIARMGWTPPVDGSSRVWMFRLDRDQNDLDLLYGDPTDMAVETILQESETTWIDVESAKLTFLDDDRHFVWMSETSGYRHLSLYELDGTRVGDITEGEWEVSAFHGIDEAGGSVYFTATIDGPNQRHVYRAPFRVGATTAGTPVRVTSERGWHTASFSDDLRYFVDAHSSATTPTTWTLRTADGSAVRLLEDNRALIDRLQEVSVSQPEFTTVPGADGTPLPASVLRPTDFDESRVYPVLMYVYGGPGSQRVVDRWGGSRDFLWLSYLANTYDMLVVSVDNRGTGGLGKAFKSITYRRLGQIEAADQIAAAQHLGSLPYVDADRIGIWGWSYGGYMTLMSLMYGEGPDTFRAGIAGAPVTDWRQYDTIYTERYMSTPQRNPQGYDEGAPVNYADRLQDDQRLLIIHGDQDDNVHLQNSVQMIDALQAEGRQFDFMMYPGANHGVRDGRKPLHMYTMMTRFIAESLVDRRIPAVIEDAR